MADITLHRVFHPVGQGAFYSETFRTARSEICMVYDCGVYDFKERTKNIANMNNAIDTCELPNTIDFLFISHFHEDHVSGIPRLLNGRKVKHVFLPFIYKDLQIILDTVSLLITNGAQNFKALFGVAEITYIEPTNEPYGNSTEESEGSFKVNDGDYSFECTGGQLPQLFLSIQVSKQKFWKYVPYQLPLQNEDNDEIKKLLTEFKEAVKERLSEYVYANEDLLELIKQAFNQTAETTKQELRSAYDSVIGGKLNKYSLCLLSKPSFSEISSYKRYNSRVWWCNFNRPFPIKVLKTSCLYTGDYEALCNLQEDLCLHYKDSLPKIGTLQIPHHGSEKNSDEAFYDKFTGLLIGVCSFGFKNSHGHPSKAIINILIQKKVYFIPVTEFPCSKLTQQFKFFSQSPTLSLTP